MQTYKASQSWPQMLYYEQHVKHDKSTIPSVSYTHAFFEYLDRG